MKPSVRIVIFAAASLWPVATSAQQLSARVGSLSPQRAFAESAEGSVLSADARARQTREVERFRVAAGDDLLGVGGSATLGIRDFRKLTREQAIDEIFLAAGQLALR